MHKNIVWYISKQWIAKNVCVWMCEYLFRLLWVFRVEGGIISLYTNDITYSPYIMYIPINRCCCSVTYVIMEFSYSHFHNTHSVSKNKKKIQRYLVQYKISFIYKSSVKYMISLSNILFCVYMITFKPHNVTLSNLFGKTIYATKTCSSFVYLCTRLKRKNKWGNKRDHIAYNINFANYWSSRYEQNHFPQDPCLFSLISLVSLWGNNDKAENLYNK